MACRRGMTENRSIFENGIVGLAIELSSPAESNSVNFRSL
jgi:hypothetical protein